MTLIVGVLAVVGVALTVRQRTVADKRAQAWQRITWCLDHTVSDSDDETVSDSDDEAELGWDVFATVTDSPLITSTERKVLLAVAGRSARRALAQPCETEDTDVESEQENSR